MKGHHHARTRHIKVLAIGAGLLLTALPGSVSVAAAEPAALPRCASLGTAASDEGEVVSPWRAVLNQDGAVVEHRLTLRHEGTDTSLRTGRRGFVVRAAAGRLLIGQRGEAGTRLDLVDTRRACRLWTRQLARAAFPQRGEADEGPIRLSLHDPADRRYAGTLSLDPETGSSEGLAQELCLEACLPHDGEISLAALEPAGAARPTPNFAAGGWGQDKTLPYRWRPDGIPPSWAKTPLKAAADDAHGTSFSRSPEFPARSGAANLIGYTGSLPGFCSGTAIACAGRAMPVSWAAWIRPYGTEFAWGTLRWCQKTSASSGCFDIRRVMLHELGHIVGLNHPSSAGFSLGSGDSIMQAITPARPQPGASRHAFGRCDVATLQELYDSTDHKTAISTCNDVATRATLTASRSSISRGSAVKLTAQLRVDSRSAYRQLSGNPLNGRSLQLKYRRAGSADAWKALWMRSLYSQGRYEASLAPGATWEFKAVFAKPQDEGLRYSRSDIVKVKVKS
jgi:hypothetical protein